VGCITNWCLLLKVVWGATEEEELWVNRTGALVLGR